jgi:hypothetical protein
MSQLGRIGGQVLTDNLLRAGIDLAFQNDLLYLDVINRRIGINRGVPVYDLDVDGDTKTTDLEVLNQIAPGNLRITAPNTFSTSVGPINVYIGGTEIFHDKVIIQASGNPRLSLDGNLISSFSNQNIVFDPSGSGNVRLLATTNVNGDVGVSGNIGITGNLSAQGTLTIGDNVIDTVTVNTDFTQDVLLGDDIIYDLGSPTKRWDRVYTSDPYGFGPAGTGITTSNVTISDQILINGPSASITTIQSNEDLFLNPSSGTTILESIAWNSNSINNTLNSPLQLISTNRGYVQFNGTNGLVIPSGDNSQRRPTPEVGETRWNTEELYLECFDGSVWNISTGAGEEVTQELMSDIGNVWTLVLG